MKIYGGRAGKVYKCEKTTQTCCLQGWNCKDLELGQGHEKTYSLVLLYGAIPTWGSLKISVFWYLMGFDVSTLNIFKIF